MLRVAHVVLCQLEWVKSWSGHHQWVCSLQGTQWEDRNGWTKGNEDKCEVCVWSVRGWVECEVCGWSVRGWVELDTVCMHAISELVGWHAQWHAQTVGRSYTVVGLWMWIILTNEVDRALTCLRGWDFPDEPPPPEYSQCAVSMTFCWKRGASISVREKATSIFFINQLT